MLMPRLSAPVTETLTSVSKLALSPHFGGFAQFETAGAEGRPGEEAEKDTSIVKTKQIMLTTVPDRPSVIGSPTLKTLVAEDDPHDQMLFVMAADDCSIDLSIEFTSDGQELIDELRARAASGCMPDLVVLDMWMPRLDGHEVLQVIQAEPEIRPRELGVFSSSFRQQDIDRSLSFGAKWHEVKPSRYEELVAFVERISATTMANRDTGNRNTGEVG